MTTAVSQFPAQNTCRWSRSRSGAGAQDAKQPSLAFSDRLRAITTFEFLLVFALSICGSFSQGLRQSPALRTHQVPSKDHGYLCPHGLTPVCCTEQLHVEPRAETYRNPISE
eukprot:s5168_g2.t1